MHQFFISQQKRVEMEMKIKYSVSQGGVAGCDLEAETDS